MTLLIVGDPEDLTSAYLCHMAERGGVRVRLLAETDFGLGWTFRIDAVSGAAGIDLPDGALPLDQVSGAFVRFNPQPSVPEPLRDDPANIEAYARERRAALHALLHALPCPVANRPGCGQANGSKPLQMAQLVASGFRVPTWIASNRPAAVSAFLARVGDAVVKSCSGTRSEVRSLGPEDAARVEGSSPVIIQERIDGHDVRLHTVGPHTFTTMISAGPGIDYRFATSRRTFAPCDAPPEIITACQRYAEKTGLLIAGFDFRVTDDGTWWCLECNPAPTFLPYELETGQPIAAALLEMLGSR